MTERWKHLVGSGSFGEVFKGRLPPEFGGASVAVKRSKQKQTDMTTYSDIQRELHIVRMTMVRGDGSVKCAHPNLVGLLGYCTDL